MPNPPCDPFANVYARDIFAELIREVFNFGQYRHDLRELREAYELEAELKRALLEELDVSLSSVPIGPLRVQAAKELRDAEISCEKAEQGAARIREREIAIESGLQSAPSGPSPH